MKKQLTYMETLKMIDEVKKHFEGQLEEKLQIMKVQCPLFVRTSSGLQDGLTGVEKAVGFMKGEEQFEIVHSLAKWKREALGRYGFEMHTGLYTDMKAIRKEEIVDDLHSLYVEQWDWEKVIRKSDRTEEYLKETVRAIYEGLKATSKYMKEKYDFLTLELPEEITFITSQELEDLYPDKPSKEREELFAKEKGAYFIIGIGDKLTSGKPHDLRSPDYDDWKLNGDLIVYDPAIGKAMELSSMGIRVDEDSLVEQLEKAGCMDRLPLPYHQKVLHSEIPYTIGGGLGITRIFMLLLERTHVAEVQASSWQDETIEALLKKDEKIL